MMKKSVVISAIMAGILAASFSASAQYRTDDAQQNTEVQAILDNYILIEEDASDDTIVSLGCTVTVLDVDMDEEEEYRIVGSQEADPMNGRISEESPFGKALLGRKVGDVVIVEAPAGNIKYKIVEIQK